MLLALILGFTGSHWPTAGLYLTPGDTSAEDGWLRRVASHAAKADCSQARAGLRAGLCDRVEFATIEISSHLDGIDWVDDDVARKSWLLGEVVDGDPL